MSGSMQVISGTDSAAQACQVFFSWPFLHVCLMLLLPYPKFTVSSGRIQWGNTIFGGHLGIPNKIEILYQGRRILIEQVTSSLATSMHLCFKSFPQWYNFSYIAIHPNKLLHVLYLSIFLLFITFNLLEYLSSSVHLNPIHFSRSVLNLFNEAHQ